LLIFKSHQELQNHLHGERKKGHSIGFVPTMGALHQGHISLLDLCNAKCDVSVVSIFVNPLQFNNKEDLAKYPVQHEQDLSLLRKNRCDVVYLPENHDILGDEIESIQLNLGNLDQVLEGKFRPGHFDGVVQIVHRLFKIVQPNIAVFGEKDLQQVAVIKQLQKSFYPDVLLIVAPTKREANGLAMSSRNMRLSDDGKIRSAVIFEAFNMAKTMLKSYMPSKIITAVKNKIETAGLEVEYVSIVDAETFEDLSIADQWKPKSYICCAVTCEGVRLIDNFSLDQD
jgi:pantoate--beta-alanine ligase